MKLYKELKAAVEKDNVIKLTEGFSFPSEALNLSGNVLLTRKSHVELYELFNLAVLNGTSPSMLLLGTTGVGKVSMIYVLAVAFLNLFFD